MEDINSKADINHIHSNVTPNPNGTAGFMSPADKSKLDDIENGAQVNTIESIKVNNNTIAPNASDKSVNITINKSTVGLGNVDNTKDADKPISTETQTALNNKSDINHNHDSEYANIDHTHTKDEIIDLTEATTTKSGLMSYADKNKLDNIASGAEANVQSDWNQTTTTADDYIKNKPSNLVQDAN